MQPGGSFFGRYPCRFATMLPSHVSVHLISDAKGQDVVLRFDAADVQPPQPYAFTVREAEELRDALDEAIMTAVKRER